MKKMLESWLQKTLVEKKQNAARDESKLEDLLEAVALVDDHLPWRDFFEENGIELLSIFFKLTFYGHKLDKVEDDSDDIDEIKPRKKVDSEAIAYSVCNLDNFRDLGKVSLDPEAAVPDTTGKNATKSKVNFIANKLMYKLLNVFADKMALLIAASELLYFTGTEARSTKRLAKTLIFFAEMARVLQESGEGIMSKHDQSKMFQGTLF